jgi:hypothetical protein
MANTKDRLIVRAEEVRPYVDRALHDEELRSNLKEAFTAAQGVYNDLVGNRGAVGVAQRVASDKDIQDNLRKAVDELRSAAGRVQGKEDHSTRNRMLLLAGITAGILFNPVTGPATRKWLMDLITGGDDDYDYGATAPPPPATTTNSGSTASGAASTSSSGSSET